MSNCRAAYALRETKLQLVSDLDSPTPEDNTLDGDQAKKGGSGAREMRSLDVPFMVGKPLPLRASPIEFPVFELDRSET